MPNTIHLSHHSADFSLAQLWGGLPYDVKGLIVLSADLATRKLLRTVNHEMCMLVENTTAHLRIRDVTALRVLADSNRFKGCRALSFDRINIERLDNLRPSIRSIDLRKLANLNSDVVDDILRRSWNSLRFSLPPCMFYSDSIGRLFSLSNATLTSLKLDGFWGIGNTGAMTLSGIKTLEVLSACKCYLTNSGAIALAKLPRLRKLAICENSVQNEGLLALLSKTSLTSLKMSHNDLCYDSMTTAVWQAISQHSSLTSLDLGYNKLHQQPDVSQYLAKNALIKKLRIAGNGLGDDDAIRLTEMRSLTELDAANNKLERRGVLALTKHTQITRLNLGYPSFIANDPRAKRARTDGGEAQA